MHTLEHTTETLSNVHSEAECQYREACPIHRMSNHNMRSFPQHWRDDRGIMERICPHGVGHPDPDQWEYLVEEYGYHTAKSEFVHGCDGCCSRKIPFEGENI